MRIDPFSQIDKLIQYGLKIPVYETEHDILRGAEDHNNFIEPRERDVVDLGELLTFIKQHQLKLQGELEDLKRDFKRVMSNGSIHAYNDIGYYDNFRAVDESKDIRDKWFILIGNELVYRKGIK